jgi:hypothetical protein
MKKRDNTRKRLAFANWVGRKDAHITFSMQMENISIKQTCEIEKHQLGKL